MNILDPIQKLFGFNSEDTMLGTSEAFDALQNNRLPPSRDKRGILEAYHEVPILRMCVSKIAHTVADTQWQALTEGADEPDPDHRALELFTKPNSRQPGYIFMMISQAYLDLVGEVIWLTLPSDYNATGRELLPVPPTAATQRPDDEGNMVWEVKLGSMQVELADEYVASVKMPNLGHPYGRGHGMGQTLADEIQVDEYAAKHISSTFHNHARPDMMVFMPGVHEKQFKKIKEKWYEEYGGPQNSGKIMFSGANEADAEMSAVEMSRSLGDSEAAATRTMQEEKVRKGFGIPPEILGDSKDSNRATIEAAEVIYNKNVVKPRLSLWTSAINHHVIPKLDRVRRGVTVQAPDPVPEDKERKGKLMKEHPDCFKKNEVRRLAGEEPLDELEGELMSAPSSVPPTPAEDDGGDKGFEAKDFELDLYSKSQQENDADQVAEATTDPEAPEFSEIQAASILATQEAASEMIGSLGSSAEDVELGNLRPGIEREIDKRMREIWAGEIDKTTEDRVRKVILDGFEDGKNPREIKKDLGEAFGDMESSRAETIAQNEMGAASSEGKQSVYEEAKAVQYKSWLHPWGLKPGARKQHEFMENKTRETPIPVEQEFVMPDGHSGQQPHQMGTPSHDVWCHCSTLPVTNPDKSMSDEERAQAWQDWNAKQEQRVEEFQEVVRSYFAAQRERAIDAFERIIEPKV